MKSKFVPSDHEEKIYRFWEENDYFKAGVDRKKKPFSIILPPPNANADLHMGHAMYVYEDIMIRYYKLKGRQTLWLPGADHAGFETQYVFEKQLKMKGKSRFDYQRDALYKMIWDFVAKNRGNMERQLKKLGFALDWQKEKFTLDDDIVEIVYRTFKKLYDNGLVYRGKRLVNYCVNCGTSFSDLEVVHREINGRLWFIKYPLKENSKLETRSSCLPADKAKQKYIVVATTRPETMLGDIAVAVHPKDKRYKDLVGETVVLPIVNRQIPIVADEAVDKKFGTGAVKVTPAHDETDWQISEKHKLDKIQVIGFDGRMTKEAGSQFSGLTAGEARKKVLRKLKANDLIEKEKKHKMTVRVCYKCDNPIEPLAKEQWFIKIRPLADKTKKLVEWGEIKVYPRRFAKILISWLEKFHDWNISRQIVWGIRIPAYKCKKFEARSTKSETKSKWFVSVKRPKKCQICGGEDFVQDEDTFDTWFSSAQWPFATLISCSKSNKKNKKLKVKENNNIAIEQDSNKFFNYFYPISVMETGYDILPWWVARMIMVGYYITKKPPFKLVFLHGLIRDEKGQKMSKSKENVVNPMVMVEKYGADALRAALVFQNREGSDIAFLENRILGMRNFANKIWNIGRFIYINQQAQKAGPKHSGKNSLPPRHCKEQSDKESQTIKKLTKEFESEKKKILKDMNSYRFSSALGRIHAFLWHRLADFYLEELKETLRNGKVDVYRTLKKVYLETLVLLHPYMPYVTEAVWQVFHGEKTSILDANIKDKILEIKNTY